MEKEKPRDPDFLISELSEARFVSSQLMPSVCSKYLNCSSNFEIKKQITRDTPIINQIMVDPKPTNLFYEPNIDLQHPRQDYMVPNFRVTTQRKCMLPGMRGSLRFEGNVEDANLGTDGQGYGLAGYTKGQQSVDSVDPVKA